MISVATGRIGFSSMTSNNLYVGSAIGSLKGVNVKKENGTLQAAAKNLIRDRANLSGQHEIKCMKWSNESEILIGTKNSFRIFNTIDNELVNSFALPENECCGIFKVDERIFVGTTSGSVQSISMSQDEPQWTEELRMNQPIDRLRLGVVPKKNIVATGGQKNDLKLWDLNTRQMTFNAKNIKPDELQLEIPMWVSDIAFCSQSDKVVTCSRHGYIRLYDPSESQRRPVFNTHLVDQVFTCIAAPTEQQFLVGSGTGGLFLVDVRGKNSKRQNPAGKNSRPKGPFVGKYEGFTGAVKEVVSPPNQSLVFSVSLDRHLRIHDFSTRELVLQKYMQTRLTTILPRKSFKIETNKLEPEDDCTDASFPANRLPISDEDVEDTDSLFEKMEKIDDANAKKSSVRSKKKKFPEADVSEDVSENSREPKRIRWKR